jgi:tetratricopeptide (TPR) repeat protein
MRKQIHYQATKWTQAVWTRLAGASRRGKLPLFICAVLVSLSFTRQVADGILGPQSAPSQLPSGESGEARSKEHPPSNGQTKTVARQPSGIDAKQPHVTQGGAADSGGSVSAGPSLLETVRSQASNTDDLDQVRVFENEIKAGKLTEVDPLLATYLKDHPNSWRAHYMLGYVSLRLRKIGESLKELSKSLELNINNADAHKDLGQVLSIIGRYEEAQRELEAARGLEPDSPEIHYDLSRVLAVQDKFPQARQELETAIRLNPNYKEAYNALGFALAALGDDAGALASYQRAIQISEKEGVHFDAPYVNLSAYYNHQGKFDLSLAYARKALEQNPNSDVAYFQMGRTYRALGDWPRAAEALEHAVAIKPFSSQYHYILGLVYRKLGKVKESQEQMEIFERLERKAADLELMRREGRHATSRPQPEDEH